jgi:hypothetical protein
MLRYDMVEVENSLDPVVQGELTAGKAKKDIPMIAKKAAIPRPAQLLGTLSP